MIASLPRLGRSRCEICNKDKSSDKQQRELIKLQRFSLCAQHQEVKYSHRYLRRSNPLFEDETVVMRIEIQYLYKVSNATVGSAM